MKKQYLEIMLWKKTEVLNSIKDYTKSRVINSDGPNRNAAHIQRQKDGKNCKVQANWPVTGRTSF